MTTATSSKDLILESVRRLTEHSGFGRFLVGNRLRPGDLVVINNSFVFRDIKTTKSPQYLSLTVGEDSKPGQACVTRGLKLNSDLKHIAAQSKNLPDRLAMDDAVRQAIVDLGHLVFLLIGTVEDDQEIAAELEHGLFSRIVWRPTHDHAVSIDSREIIVKDVGDEELLWQMLTQAFGERGSNPPAGLREALGPALDALQTQAIARVVIPERGSCPGSGITDAILAVVKEQRDEYAGAVECCAKGGVDAASALNQVLRIAYNFASDAAGFIRLIVSVCDLKPIVLWGTIAEHYALSEAFNGLPWLAARRKPSLKNYQQSIADARNSAFHNLFPFRKSLRVKLPEGALGATELQIFSEHSQKSSNQLTYREKELVDVLTEFTRARERRLPLAFWLKNIEVMDATIRLFERTSEFIKALAQSR